MRIRTLVGTWTKLTCTMCLLVGTSAMADDTELLLVASDPGNKPKPNVMFIIDTSGSMKSEEETIAPYDPSRNYNGSCANDRHYWTDLDVVPVCDGSEQNYFLKSVFECEDASISISGIGTYSDTMVQFRSGGGDGLSTGPVLWQTLAPGYHSQQVECFADSGAHGDGSPGYLWAVSGSDMADPFTNDPDSELSWGSAPRNARYTVYDGNFLNWKENPETIQMERRYIVQSVLNSMFSSLTDVNVGLMRFTGNTGGRVIKTITNLDDNRQEVLDRLLAMNLGGNSATPMSETMYENALYWLGRPAKYGQEGNSDPAAFASTNPEVYKQPATELCAKNFNVLLTDGVAHKDLDTVDFAPTLPDFSTVLGRTACSALPPGVPPGKNGSTNECLDDLAEYMSLVDVDGVNDGVQPVVTHMIGFAIDLPILKLSAEASGGQYFLADDVESLTNVFTQILQSIEETSLSFASPAVSVNSFNRTRNLNDLYLPMFGARSNVHWPGNLKKYKLVNEVVTDANGVAAIDPDTGLFRESSQSFWTAGADGNEVEDGGAAQKFPDPTVRNLYTNNGGGADLTASANTLTVSNASAFSAADFGLSGATGEPSVDNMIRWMRGEDVQNEDDDESTTTRNVMGDPLHSQPAAIVYGGTPAAPDVIVYTATNDGYLHAINGLTGVELWSFIPHELLNNQARLYFNASAQFKHYGIDGNVTKVVIDRNHDGVISGSDSVYIIFGLRRGGNSYYALDVTDRNAPRLMWQFNQADMGQSWSTPVITRVNVNMSDTNDDDAVVIIGGGYDSVHDSAVHPSSPDGSGAGIHMLDLLSGAELWSAGPNAADDLQLASMTRAIPNRISVADLSGDGFADRMYASDLGGQLFRFDIFNGQAPGSLVHGGVIARLGAEGLAAPAEGDTRRFYTPPDVSVIIDSHQDRRFIAINIGSGYRAHPFDLSASDRFFSIRDKDVFNQLSQDQYDSYPIVDDASLVEVSGQTQVVLGAADRGWKFTLPSNQKVLSKSLTFSNEVFFVAFSPESSASTNCGAGAGTNYLYRVSAINGDPVMDSKSALDALDPENSDDARQQELSQGGIAPSPTMLFPSPDDPVNCTGDDCSPPPILCVGLDCSDPGFNSRPVRTLWTQDGIQ